MLDVVPHFLRYIDAGIPYALWRLARAAVVSRVAATVRLAAAVVPDPPAAAAIVESVDSDSDASGGDIGSGALVPVEVWLENNCGL